MFNTGGKLPFRCIIVNRCSNHKRAEVSQQEGGEQMGRTASNQAERRVRHGGDAHRPTPKEPQGPVQGFSQAPKGLQ
jgi:hypothetical protein